MSRAQENIKVEPMEVKFCQVQTDCIVVEAGSVGLSAKYFTFSSSTVDYYVWYNTGASVDPALAGKTGIEVEILATDTQAAVATAVVTAVNAVAGLLALVDPRNTGRVILKVLEYVAGTHAAAGTTTAHVFVPIHDGFAHDFGYTDGDLELTLDQQLLDVTAHQTGTEILTALVTGMNVELAVALKEVSADNLERLIELTTGGAMTPPGVGATKLQGYGSGQNFLNVMDKAGRLILHPARLADSIVTDDLCCWLAYPKVDSLMFSGENPKMINVTFRVFRDDFIDEAVNKVAIGDHTQL